MNFEDILNQWENQQRKAAAAPKKKPVQISRKMANAPTPEEKAARKRENAIARGEIVSKYDEIMESQAKERINPMEMWLRRYGTTDKDKENDQYEERSRMESREYLRTMKPEARIDLHGLTRDEAWSKLTYFVLDCMNRGLKKILIVHGKGNHSHGSDPVLGQMVRTFIEQNKHLGTSGHPDHRQGGTGATWVIIK